MPILIPKQKEDLVVIPRRQYEEFLEWRKKEVNMTVSQKRALQQARKNISRGKFLTLHELKQKLEATN